ncbi:MAG: putative selenium-dependent hydroxylase accessory protein YqeC [Deltaproteobacteria bacterium]|nr:putative selenium-dependent hydroxylase accessory protein YqeC [Deltaproteobacteria bacterium]
MISLQNALRLDGGGIISLVGAGGKTSLMFTLAHELAGKGSPVLTTTTTKIFFPGNAQSPHVVFSGTVDGIIIQANRLLRHSPHITASPGYDVANPKKLSGFAPSIIDGLLSKDFFKWIIVEADGSASRPLKAPASHEPVIPRKTKWVIGVCGLNALGKPFNEKWVFRPELFSRITGLSQSDTITEKAFLSLIKHPQGLFKGSPLTTRKLLFLNRAENTILVESGRLIADNLLHDTDVDILSIVIGRALDKPHVVASISK